MRLLQQGPAKIGDARAFAYAMLHGEHSETSKAGGVVGIGRVGRGVAK